MRPITVRPIRFEDVVEGATVYAQKHKDFVLEYEIVSVKDRDIEEGGSYRNAHCKDHTFGSEWGFYLRHDGDGGPAQMTASVPWYVEVVEPETAPIEDWLERRVIEPEGVSVTVQVFVPNEQALAWSEGETAVEAAQDIVRSIIAVGTGETVHEGVVVDHVSARPVSENHVHVFDIDGILLHEDIRSSKMYSLGAFGHGIYVIDALEVDVREAQRQIIRELADQRAQREVEMASRTRGRRH